MYYLKQKFVNTEVDKMSYIDLRIWENRMWDD